MYLLINTCQPEAELYLYDGQSREAIDKWMADRQLTESIHLHIKVMLESHGLKEKDLTGIGIFRGPGSFTGLRIGHSVANAFAYGFSLPIVGTIGEEWAVEAVSRLDSGENDKIVMPEYGSQARVTLPRK